MGAVGKREDAGGDGPEQERDWGPARESERTETQAQRWGTLGRYWECSGPRKTQGWVQAEERASL